MERECQQNDTVSSAASGTAGRRRRRAVGQPGFDSGVEAPVLRHGLQLQSL